MNNFDEYIHFVIGAKINGQDIEYKIKLAPHKWAIPRHLQNSEWDFINNLYRIKLPTGWEYVIENGEIAFREPKKGEWIITMHGYETYKSPSDGLCKRPIIKRIDNSEVTK